MCQTSFTNSFYLFYLFTVIWVHYMYCLLQLVSNGLTPVSFMLTFKWCTHNVPCTQIASTQCYLPIQYCVCGPSGWSLVCCEQLEVLLSCAQALHFLAHLDSDCCVGSHSCGIVHTPSCFVSLVGWQSASCPHCPDTTTYVAMPRSLQQTLNRITTFYLIILYGLTSPPTDCEVF